jgi:tetratricopeptide (TPR) repeat protein
MESSQKLCRVVNLPAAVSSKTVPQPAAPLLAVYSRVFGPEHPGTLISQAGLAGILLKEGRYAESEKRAREAFEAESRIFGSQSFYTQDALRQLGMALAYNHRYDEAGKLFRDEIEKINNSKGQGDQVMVWYEFACVATAANHPDDALQYLQEAVTRGYKSADAMMADPDLKGLHNNPKFQQLVSELRHTPTRNP